MIEWIFYAQGYEPWPMCEMKIGMMVTEEGAVLGEPLCKKFLTSTAMNDGIVQEMEDGGITRTFYFHCHTPSKTSSQSETISVQGPTRAKSKSAHNILPESYIIYQV